MFLPAFYFPIASLFVLDPIFSWMWNYRLKLFLFCIFSFSIEKEILFCIKRSLSLIYWLSQHILVLLLFIFFKFIRSFSINYCWSTFKMKLHSFNLNLSITWFSYILFFHDAVGWWNSIDFVRFFIECEGLLTKKTNVDN